MRVYGPRNQCPDVHLRPLDMSLSSAIPNELCWMPIVFSMRTLSFLCRSSKKHSYFPAGTSIICAETRDWKSANSETHNRGYICCIIIVVLEQGTCWRLSWRLSPQVAVTAISFWTSLRKRPFDSFSSHFYSPIISLFVSDDLLIQQRHGRTNRCSCCQGAFLLIPTSGRNARSIGILTEFTSKTDEEHDPHYEPVIRLTEQVDTKTGEEEDDVIFKMYVLATTILYDRLKSIFRKLISTFFIFRRAKLFRFEASSSEWKERGTGDVRLLRNKESKKVRLVMRRDKTLKVCANHTSEPPIPLYHILTIF